MRDYEIGDRVCLRHQRNYVDKRYTVTDVKYGWFIWEQTKVQITDSNLQKTWVKPEALYLI